MSHTITDIRAELDSDLEADCGSEFTTAGSGSASAGASDIDSAEEFVDPALFHHNPLVRLWARALQATREHLDDEGGMSTIEYALGCVAAAALGALLYTVVTSGAVEDALSGIFERALNEGGQK